MSPSVAHWIYTRSFGMMTPLLDVSTTAGGNLALNLSADAENYERARALANGYGLRVCYMTLDGVVPPDLRKGDVIFPDYKFRNDRVWFESLPPHQRAMVCPVDFYGKNERIRCGPCRRCLK
jgi:hypothetical protein